MPRPGVGNPGNKGGGRKSAYQERADALTLEKLFFDEQVVSDIREKIESGKYSMKDIFALKGLQGNENVMTKVFQKLFPEKHNIDVKGRITDEIVHEQIESQLESNEGGV